MNRYTDRQTLTRHAYRDGGALSARQSIYRWQRPRVDLTGAIIGGLSGAAEVIARDGFFAVPTHAGYVRCR